MVLKSYTAQLILPSIVLLAVCMVIITFLGIVKNGSASCRKRKETSSAILYRIKLILTICLLFCMENGVIHCSTHEAKHFSSI